LDSLPHTVRSYACDKTYRRCYEEAGENTCFACRIHKSYWIVMAVDVERSAVEILKPIRLQETTDSRLIDPGASVIEAGDKKWKPTEAENTVYARASPGCRPIR